MFTIEQLQERLKYMNLTAVSDASGLHKNLLYRLVNQSAAGYSTVRKLSDFFDGLDAEQEKGSRHE